jgi:hypothetical protein
MRGTLITLLGFILIIYLPLSLIAQHLVVEGKAKITVMDTVINSPDNIVRNSDGTLGIRHYRIGDYAHGGIVFFVDETGEHGLVCTKLDQSGGARWYAGTSGRTNAVGDGPSAGEMNTMIIIASQVAIGDDGNTYAARICAELQINEQGKTYGDWYLPSKEELNFIYQNKDMINTIAVSNGGSDFENGYYWSSTEHWSNIDFAWVRHLGNGSQAVSGKAISNRVRAIRTF